MYQSDALADDDVTKQREEPIQGREGALLVERNPVYVVDLQLPGIRHRGKIKKMRDDCLAYSRLPLPVSVSATADVIAAAVSPIAFPVSATLILLLLMRVLPLLLLLMSSRTRRSDCC